MSGAQDVVSLTVGVFAVIAGLVAFSRWVNRGLEKKILDELREATRPIQPGTNGGRSLTDLHKKFDDHVRESDTVKAELLRRIHEVIDQNNEMGLQQLRIKSEMNAVQRSVRDLEKKGKSNDVDG